MSSHSAGPYDVLIVDNAVADRRGVRTVLLNNTPRSASPCQRPRPDLIVAGPVLGMDVLGYREVHMNWLKLVAPPLDTSRRQPLCFVQGRVIVSNDEAVRNWEEHQSG